MAPADSTETALALIKAEQRSHTDMDAVQFRSLSTAVDELKAGQTRMSAEYTKGIERVHERVDSINNTMTKIDAALPAIAERAESASKIRSQKDKIWQLIQVLGLALIIIGWCADRFVFKEQPAAAASHTTHGE